MTRDRDELRTGLRSGLGDESCFRLDERRFGGRGFGRERPEAGDDAYEQGECRGLGSDTQEGVHLRRCAFEHVRAPEVERDGGEFERQSHAQEQRSHGENHRLFGRHIAKAFGKLNGERRQMQRVQRTGDQADSVEHDARGAGSVDRVLQGRFAALPTPLKHRGQGVRRHAGHFHAQEHDQQMVGGGHQAHAQRRAEHERVDVRAVRAIGKSGESREEREQQREQEQDGAQIDGEAVVDQHAGEQFLSIDSRPGAGDSESGDRARDEDQERADEAAQRRHAGQQHDDDRRANHQLGAELRNAPLRVGNQLADKNV